MGTAMSSHDDLVHMRGWTKEQITALFETLRKKHIVYTLTKEDYRRFVGGRNFEAVSVFNDLDDDCDGRVDIFEVFVTLTLWSGTSWEEKQDLLFRLFDMMDKGFLKVDEVLLLGTVLVQVLRKFVTIESHYADRSFMKDLAQQAFEQNQTQMQREAFFRWFGACKAWEELHAFLDDHAARAQPDSNGSRMRVEMGVVELHAARIFERIEILQDRIPDFSDHCIESVDAWGRRKRWDFSMQNLRHTILKLHQVSEDMHVKLTALDEMVTADEGSGGLSTMVDPRKRFQQEHTLIELKQMRATSLADYREATTMIQRLLELAEPVEPITATQQQGELEVISEHDGVADICSPRALEARVKMKSICAEMVADISEGGIFGQRFLTDFAEQATKEAVRKSEVDDAGAHALEAALAAEQRLAQAVKLGSSEPTLVVIADFDPPRSHSAQMLRLLVGEHVIVLGQDGRGWWYGRKPDTGAEGWFPPSYVQVKPAHHTILALGAEAETDAAVAAPLVGPVGAVGDRVKDQLAEMRKVTSLVGGHWQATTA